MFQSITYLRYENKTNECIYQLVDDDFICSVSARATIAAAGARAALRGALGAALVVVVAVAAVEYKKRNLPVAKNIVLLYLDYQQKGYDISGWENYNYKWIDKYYPELEYSKLYHSQIVNQLHKIMMLS